MEKNKKEGKKDTTPNKITFYNKLSYNFTQVYADGVFGSVTPKGLININFFSERLAIPLDVTFNVTQDGKLGEKVEENLASKKGVIRDYNFGVFIDVNTAKAFRSWLDDKIKLAENINQKDKEV